MKYVVLSDLHAHAWSVFARPTGSGANSRLMLIIEEMHRASRELKAQGGNTMIIAGDIFHARGTIDPEVLNPVRDAIDEILAMEIDIFALPGNHDLKSQDTNRLSSAIQNLDQDHMSGRCFRVVNKACIRMVNGGVMGFVPWRSTHVELLEDLEALSKHPQAAAADVFIHAGIDGVLSGVPGSGLNASVLAKFGFRRVFAGHYHNHTDLGAGVYSIGATTHHNWGDIDTRAGFLTVDTDPAVGFHGVTFNDTMAPKFVDVSGMDETEMEIECSGNYVRFRGPQMTQLEVNELRDAFVKWGAVGVTIQVPKVVIATRTGSPTKGMSIDTSIDQFVDASTTIPASVDKALVKRRAAEVLAATRLLVEEA